MEENKTAEPQNNSRSAPEKTEAPESAKPHGGYQYKFDPSQQKKRRAVFSLGRFFLGLVLIIVGLLFLARAFGWLYFDFSFNISQLWPLLLIILGLSMLATKSRLVNIFCFIILMMVIMTVLFLIFGGVFYKNTVYQNKIDVGLHLSVPDSKIAWR